MNKIFTSAAVTVTVLASLVFADTIVMNDGQIVEKAKVLKVGDREIEYKVGNRKVVYAVSKSDVARITYKDGTFDAFPPVRERREGAVTPSYYQGQAVTQPYYQDQAVTPPAPPRHGPAAAGAPKPKHPTPPHQELAVTPPPPPPHEGTPPPPPPHEGTPPTPPNDGTPLPPPHQR